MPRPKKEPKTPPLLFKLDEVFLLRLVAVLNESPYHFANKHQVGVLLDHLTQVMDKTEQKYLDDIVAKNKRKKVENKVAPAAKKRRRRRTKATKPNTVHEPKEETAWAPRPLKTMPMIKTPLQKQWRC